MTKEEITADFNLKVNELIERKHFRNKREIVDKLEWNESAFSAAMKGDRPVPQERYSKLIKLYNSVKKNIPSLISEGTPIYDIAATATQAEMVSQVPEIPNFYVNVPGYEDCNFGMYVHGHSMYPTIENGSLILCRKLTDKGVIMYGEIYLIRTADYLMVKRIQKNEDKKHVLCTSDNFEKRSNDYRRYEPFELERDKILDLYLVKGIIKKTQS